MQLNSFLFYIVAVITGSRDVSVDESRGPARVCARLSGTATTSTDVPIQVTFTPMAKSNADDPAEGIHDVKLHLYDPVILS